MRWLLLFFPVLLFVGCESGSSSTVPVRPVSLRINTDEYGSMRCVNAYMILNADGLYEGTVWRRKPLASESWGYAGVVVFMTTSTTNPYIACDLCCPHCQSAITPCEVTGLYAECPLCGEQYDLTCSGVPCKGIAREPLKRYSVMYSFPYITVTN